MNAHGENYYSVLSEISEYRSNDIEWEYVLNSICSKPLDIGCEAFHLGIQTNLGDARIFKGTSKLEDRAIEQIGGLLNNSEAIGNIVSGGTEANLLALYNARLINKISEPEIIIPATAHFSIKKIANILNLHVKIAEVDKFQKVIPEAIKELITENTIAIVATAGTSEFGSIDPIEEIAAIAVKHNIYFHVDAATGGFIIPFAKKLGYELPEFDFKIKGVQSITVDPHKYGLTPISSGAIIFRNKEVCSNLVNHSFFARTPAHKTFLGTRSGACIHAVYAVLKYFGMDGFIKITKDNFEKTIYLQKELKKHNFDLYMDPELNIVSIKVKDSEQLVKRFEDCGWMISASIRVKNVLRIVIHHHVDYKTIDRFIEMLIKYCE